jgi:hypothetical protein
MTELGYDMAKVTSWDEERKAEQEKEREAMAKQPVMNGKAPFMR